MLLFTWYTRSASGSWESQLMMFMLNSEITKSDLQIGTPLFIEIRLVEVGADSLFSQRPLGGDQEPEVAGPNRTRSGLEW